MPIDKPEWQGTEKDGSRSIEYCRYCYQEGKFVQPPITLEEMTSLVRRTLQVRHFPQHFIDASLSKLPELKRWKKSVESKVLIM
jgi:hypothetical protein